MKARLRLMDGHWVCYGFGMIGWAPTVMGAYENWSEACGSRGKTLADCKAKFSNVANFQSAPYLGYLGEIEAIRRAVLIR